MSTRVARKPDIAAPDLEELRDAALTYLSRYAATEAGLVRVLDRRVDRWARSLRSERPESAEEIAAAVSRSRHDVRALVARLVEAGAVDDPSFATTRARSLVRSGKSNAAIAAHLMAKGVPTDIARDALPDDADYEVGAALSLARRRRIGPFRRGEPPDAEGRLREAAIMARAGFPQPVAMRALRMQPDEAEEFVNRLRQS
jgi:regulatory protein